MANNIHSSDGLAEDLIRVITQLACSEGHLKTIIEKTTAELENGIIDVDNPDEVNQALEKLEAAQNELKEIAEIRRGSMLALYEMYEGDKTYWCQVKHLAAASYTAFEVYQASDDDPTYYDLALRINNQFIQALTHFLGMEITQCASCFSDMMKGEHDEN